MLTVTSAAGGYGAKGLVGTLPNDASRVRTQCILDRSQHP